MAKNKLPNNQTARKVSVLQRNLHLHRSAWRPRAVAVTLIAAGRDAVSAWAGLCCNIPASRGLLASRAKTFGRKKMKENSPGH